MRAMAGVDGPTASRPRGWRARIHRYRTRSRPNTGDNGLTWIADERVAVGSVPTGATIGRLAAEGITHVVNCRSGVETLLSQDLAVERALFGRAHVVHAPMWDTGWRQHPRRWSAAAHFVARVLDEDADARVLIHCRAGIHRSVLVAYAALRLRQHSADDAAGLILRHRVEAELLPAYRESVDRWIGQGGPRAGTGLGRRHVGPDQQLRRSCAECMSLALWRALKGPSAYMWSSCASVIAQMWPAVAQAGPVPLIDVRAGRGSRRRSCHAGGPA